MLAILHFCDNGKILYNDKSGLDIFREIYAFKWKVKETSVYVNHLATCGFSGLFPTRCSVMLLGS